MAWVTIEQVNRALRLGLDLDIDPSAETDDSERILDVTLKIDQAQAIVIDYLKYTPLKLYELGWGDTTDTPGNVTAAIILVVRALLDDSPDSASWLSGLAGKPPDDGQNPIAALLWRLRDPALA